MRKRNTHPASPCWVSHEVWVSLCPFLDSTPQTSANNDGEISRHQRPFVLFNRSMLNALTSKQLLPTMLSFHPFKSECFVGFVALFFVNTLILIIGNKPQTSLQTGF